MAQLFDLNRVESFGPGRKMTHFWYQSTKMMMNRWPETSILKMAQPFDSNRVESLKSDAENDNFFRKPAALRSRGSKTGPHLHRNANATQS